MFKLNKILLQDERCFIGCNKIQVVHYKVHINLDDISIIVKFGMAVVHCYGWLLKYLTARLLKWFF